MFRRDLIARATLGWNGKETLQFTGSFDISFAILVFMIFVVLFGPVTFGASFLAMAPLLGSALCKGSRPFQFGLVAPWCVWFRFVSCPLGLCCVVLFRRIVGFSLFLGFVLCYAMPNIFADNC